MNSIIDQDTLKELKKLTVKLNELQENIKNTLLSAISDVPDPDGVKRISKNICIVSFKALNCADWTPEHYNSKIQAEYITKKIAGAHDIRTMLNQINNMVDSGYIRINSSYKIGLNVKVITVLQDIKNDLEKDVI